MSTFFLTALLLLCGDMQDATKALCIQDLTKCRIGISDDQGQYSESEFELQCIDGLYMTWFNDVMPRVVVPKKSLINSQRNKITWM